jgi:hypothetical protein
MQKLLPELPHGKNLLAYGVRGIGRKTAKKAHKIKYWAINDVLKFGFEMAFNNYIE